MYHKLHLKDRQGARHTFSWFKRKKEKGDKIKNLDHREMPSVLDIINS